MIQRAADDWLLERLLTFDSGSEELEDSGDADADGPTMLSFDRVPA